MSTSIEEFNMVEETEAYAKLEGPGKKEFVHKLKVFLGRDVSKVENEEQSIFIADSQKISRKHAEIYWSQEQQCWFIRNLSKNKTIVNGKCLKKEDDPSVLPPQSAIKIDRVKMYFFPAFDDNNN